MSEKNSPTANEPKPKTETTDAPMSTLNADELKKVEGGKGHVISIGNPNNFGTRTGPSPFGF
jgi:bacteriocin-like protein